MYLVLPMTAISRSIMIIQVISAETWLSAESFLIVYRILNGSLMALWYMQAPIIIERICATVFYKTYLFWKCYGTILIIIICWTWVVLIAIDVVVFPPILIIVLLAVCNIFAVSVYAYLIKVNYSRYQNRRSNENLHERHQLFTNVKSLYPIVWTVAIEMVYNVNSCVFIAILILAIMPSGDATRREIHDSVNNLIREVLFLLYCLPFLVYSDKRQKRIFLNKVNVEEQNESSIYFKQLRDQW
uniref:G_PROTEIN_RECEP_F1_2 domain-containing protein n=1 Tax=Panagrellus redivivus TaxID=6233 RepID=A0A7E4VAW7_PANRE